MLTPASRHISKNDNAPVKILRKNIKTLIEDSKSHLNTYLQSLNDEKKAELIAALLCNDGDKIVKFLQRVLLLDYAKHKLPLAELRYLPKLSAHSVDKSLFNATIKKLITATLVKANGSMLGKANISIILQKAFQSIPDTTMTILVKKSICFRLAADVLDYILDFSYNESAPLLAKNQYRGDINIDQFAAAMAANHLDYSEFIILVLGLMEKNVKINNTMKSALQRIKQYYLTTDYESAIEEIRMLVEKNKNVFGIALAQDIINKIPLLKEISINKNHIRRFFENRLAQLYGGQAIDIHAINKISQCLLAIPTNSVNEVENIILRIAEETETVRENIVDLKANSFLYSSKDRCYKPGFTPKEEDLSQAGSQTIYSATPGLGLSTTPMFYNETSQKPLINKVVDSNTISDENTGYSRLQKRAAYASSISGHMYGMVAIMDRYMLYYAQDPNLEKDINQFFKTVISVWIRRGYHSLLEATDVLNEPHIQLVFKNRGVKLDLTWPQAILDQALQDTQEYAKAICIKKSMQEQLLSFSSVQSPAYFARRSLSRFNPAKIGNRIFANDIVVTIDNLDHLIPDTHLQMQIASQALLDLRAARNKLSNANSRIAKDYKNKIDDLFGTKHKSAKLKFFSRAINDADFLNDGAICKLIAEKSKRAQLCHLGVVRNNNEHQSEASRLQKSTNQ